MVRKLLVTAPVFLMVASLAATAQELTDVTLPTCPQFGMPLANPAAQRWTLPWMEDTVLLSAALPARVSLVPPEVASASAQPPTRPRPVAVEYSEGYEKRLRIHRIASYATIPLFVAEFVLGQSLYNTPAGQPASSGTRTGHAVVAASIGGLFGLNTVTGIWNLREARKDPNKRLRPTLHGILMMVADGEFLATAMLTPRLARAGRPETSTISPSTHRAIAVTAMGTATVSYVMMLLRRN